MKKLNKKGFLIAESIIVGVFVLSLFTFLFVNVVPLVGQYEAREKYDTINGAYNANLVRTMILEDNKMAQVLELNNLPYKKYEREDLCTNENLEKANYCTKLLGDAYLNVDKIYITWYRTEEIKKASYNNDIDFDRAARDYIESLDGYKQPAGSTYDNYKRIIVAYNDGSFANIEVKISEQHEDLPPGSTGPGGTSGDELGCILTAQPAPGTKKGNNNWYTSDVKIYMTKTGAVIEHGLTTTDTPEIPVYNSQIVAEQKEDTEGITYYGYVKDIDGFEETCSIFIKKDTTSPIVDGNPEAPTPEIYNPTGGNPVSLPFSLTVKATDPESEIDYWYYSYDEENWTKYDDPAYDSYEKSEYVTSPFSAERNEMVYIKVCNKAGLCGVNSTKIHIDKTPPTCTITPSGTQKAGFYTTDVKFELYPDVAAVKYLITSTQQDMTKLTASSFDNKLEKTMNIDTEGTSWYGYIMDSAGNIGECKSVTVKRDTTPPPQPAITNPTSGNWTNTPFSLTVKSEDSNSGNEYWYYKYINDADWTTYNETGYNSLGKTTFTTSPFSTEREEDVYIRICDKAGNCSQGNTMIKIDKTAPSCVINTNISTTDNNWFTNDVTLTIETYDNGTFQSGVNSYTLSTGTSPSYGGVTQSLRNVETKSQMYYCYVKDNAGNTNPLTSFEVKLDKTEPSLKNSSKFNGFSNFYVKNSSGSVGTSKIAKYECGTKGCIIYACAQSGYTTYYYDFDAIYNSGIFNDELSGLNSVNYWYSDSSSKRYYKVFDKAGNYLSFYLDWRVDEIVGGTCSYETGTGG